MKKIDIQKQIAAEQDLIDIWLYTFGKWGESQADRYLDELNWGMQTIAENPKIGIDYSFFREGYRCFNVNHHLIFYRITEDHIEIIRILHENMDIKQNL